MSTPDEAPAIPEPTLPLERVEREFTLDEEDAFNGLHAWLLRDVERARMLSGLLAMLGAALLRRLWQLGRAEVRLALFALCAFAASGVIYALSKRLAGGAVAARAVTTTRGRDVTHAMSTLRVLRAVFRALSAALVAVAALVLVALAAQLAHR